MNTSIWQTLPVAAWIIVGMANKRLLARIVLLIVMRLKNVNRYVK